MSGLLVKSTNEMKANMIALKEAGLKLPVLIGGAALDINKFTTMIQTAAKV